MKDDLTYGQPLRKKVKGKETAETYYKLGKTAASLENQREENSRAMQMNMMQQLMLQNQVMKFQDVLAEINRKQKAFDAQIAMTQQPPPMPPEVGPPQGLGFPPLPMQGGGGGMPPPDMSGGGMPPPDMMGGGGGGMPPPDMMGGGGLPQMANYPPPIYG